MDAIPLLLGIAIAAACSIASALVGVRLGRSRERKYWSGRFKEETKRLEAEMAAEKLECWSCPACGKASVLGNRICDWCSAPRPGAYHSTTISQLEYQNQSGRPLFPDM